ncbi:hypothetical protein [Streptomyces flaveolus]|uniref:hypothetical protein n=1 Tax=Streptomyces flaveolus TaxID=67297 RepID=UPI00382087E4
MYADLAVVDGDPLTDIKDAANVGQGLVSGIAHTADSLVQPFSEADEWATAQYVPLGCRQGVAEYAPLPDHGSG